MGLGVSPLEERFCPWEPGDLSVRPCAVLSPCAAGQGASGFGTSVVPTGKLGFKKNRRRYNRTK